jgi:hypothetical protein
MHLVVGLNLQDLRTRIRILLKVQTLIDSFLCSVVSALYSWWSRHRLRCLLIDLVLEPFRPASCGSLNSFLSLLLQFVHLFTLALRLSKRRPFDSRNFLLIHLGRGDELDLGAVS